MTGSFQPIRMFKEGANSPLATFFGLIYLGIGYSVYYVVKSIWRVIWFTGSLPFLILFIIFANYPSSGLAILLALSLAFIPVWTVRNIYRSAKPITEGKHLNGVFFGVDEKNKKLGGKPITQDGHVLVVGGAGTGKSSCIAIPTLKYFWNGTFLAVDIKGELAEKSERKAHVFNPANPQALGYDPFYLVRNHDNPAGQIRGIALTLVPESPQVKDQFWIRAAQNVLTGHLISGYEEGTSFISLLKQLQSLPPDVVLEAASTNATAKMFVGQYLGVKEQTLSSIMAELSNHVIPFVGDPDIERTLRKPDIVTPELLENEESIFIQIPEHKITQWKSLITLILQQFLTHFEQRPEGNSKPILFMIDEFPRFGKMEGILNGLATLRSKKITIEIIIQSLAQLDAIYGKEQRQIITDNCAYKAILGATDSDTQKYFSALVGTHEVQRESFTKDRKSLVFHDITSSNISIVDKPIIRPEEFAYLKDIVLLTPDGFSRVKKQPYYTMKGRKPLNPPVEKI